MRAEGIVEGFQIEEDVVASGSSGRIEFQVDKFTFKAAEEIFGNGVIIGIASSGHALADTIGRQTVTKGLGGILHAAVTVEDEIPSGLAAAVSHVQSGQRQLCVNPIRKCVADNLSGAKVFHDCQVQPALAGRDIGDVAHPGLIRALEGKIPHQQIGCNGMGMVRICSRFVGSMSARGNACQLHLPMDPLAGTAKFRLQKVVQAVQPHPSLSDSTF